MKVQVEAVRTEGFEMEYFRFGRGKETLVVLPGLSVESVTKYADPVAEAYGPLAEDFTVCVFDRIKDPPAGYTVSDMARDTAIALRALGLERVNLFGVSQGGMVAMEIAIREPGLVRRLVLGSSSAAVTPEQYRPVGGWVRLAKAGKTKDLYLSFGEGIYPENVFEQSRELLASAAEHVTGADLERFVILAEGMKGFDVSGELGKIVCPVLVIGSLDDRVLTPDASRWIAKGLKDNPDAELYMYDGYGHAAYDVAPDYKERLLRFLKGESQDNR